VDRHPGASSFKDLKERIRRAGLLEKTPRYYAAKIAVNAFSTAAGWAACFVLGDSWWQLITAVYLAFWLVQTGLLVHDAGHLQVFHSRRANELTSYAHANLLLGISSGWWVNYHNRHHGHPNHLQKDPQVTGRLIALAIDESVHTESWLRRLIIRHQAALFFPLFLFYSLGMRALSMATLCRRAAQRSMLEATLIGLHFAAYFVALTVVMAPTRLVAFIVVQHAVLGLYLGLIFAPNHKGMPVWDGDEIDWVHRQTSTARNLRSTRLTHLLFGGLNYHIEHHLFPTMPRPNLRKARPIVVEYCREKGLPYHEVGMVTSYLEILSHLTAVSRAWRQRQKGL